MSTPVLTTMVFFPKLKKTARSNMAFTKRYTQRNVEV